MQAPGLVPVLLAACGDQFEGQKQRPLRLDPFKDGELLRFVVQAGDVFHRRLVTIPEKAFVAVGPTEFTSYPTAGAFHQGSIFHRPGGITNHREAGTVGFLAGGFPWQESFQGATEAHDGPLGNQQDAAAIAMGSVEVKPIECFQGGFGHADRARIALWQSMVSFVAPFPDPVVRGAVGPRDVVHQVLEKIHLITALHHGAAAFG